MHKIALLIMLVLVISACGTPTPPKRGAVEAYGGFTPRTDIKLHSSLNCAYPGEEVIFTLTLENREAFDITMIGTPVIEIELQDRNNHVVRWSADPSYPVIDPLLKQGEKRTYAWHWKAEELDGLSVAYVIAEGAPPQGNRLELLLAFGINSMSWSPAGSYGTPIKCSEVR